MKEQNKAVYNAAAVGRSSIEHLLAVGLPFLRPIDQVAFYAEDMESAITRYAVKLGLTEWTRDEVTAIGRVGKRTDVTCVANLAFNYQLGFELELLQYIQGPNWHREAGRVSKGAIGAPPFITGSLDQMFQSHYSYHVADIDAEVERLGGSAFFPIVQDVRTIKHTNPYLIECKRTFRYVIFDSRESLGFDLKLIQRFEEK